MAKRNEPAAMPSPTHFKGPCVKRIFNAALIAAAALSSLAVLIPPCRDHEGTHQYRMHTLDGTRWNSRMTWSTTSAARR